MKQLHKIKGRRPRADRAETAPAAEAAENTDTQPIGDQGSDTAAQPTPQPQGPGNPAMRHIGELTRRVEELERHVAESKKPARKAARKTTAKKAAKKRR